MKKLLVLVLILGIASLAPATLQISVNGNPDPVDSEITMFPSATLLLDIHGDVPAGHVVYWLMMVDQAMGSLSYYYDGGIGPFYYYPPLYPGYSIAYGVIGGLVPLLGLLVDDIEYHAEGAGDALVNLYSSPDTVTWTLADSLLIHQGDVPEPITITLLGLGGLLISRRRVGSK